MLVPRKDASLHASSCPKAQIECPNAACGVTVARGSMAEHRALCPREEVECPCPGCEERMARGKVDGHVQVSRALHERCVWTTIARLKQANSKLQKKVATLEFEMSALSDQGEAISAAVDEMKDELMDNTTDIDSLFVDGEMQAAQIAYLES